MPDAPPNTPTVLGPMFSSKLFRLAAACTVAGGSMWGYSAATAPPVDPQQSQVAAAPETPGVSSFTGSAADEDLSSGFAPRTATPPPSDSRAIAQASPALFRFGMSFIVGFCLAYLARRFIKWTALLAGAAIVGIYALHRAGIMQFDAAAVEAQISSSLAWLHSEAGEFREFVLGYVPSGASAAVGAFVGIRRR